MEPNVGPQDWLTGNFKAQISCEVKTPCLILKARTTR